MPDFVPGCAARTVGRAPDPLPIPESAIPSGLPATAWHSRTDVAPPRRRPPAAFPGPQNDPPAIANAPAPLRRSRCPVFAGRRVRSPSPQTPVAGTCARCPWLPLPFQSQHTPDHARNPLPILSFHGKLLLASPGNGVKLGLAVIVGRSPLRRDPALLQQPQQRRVHRTLVQLQHIAANLLDPPSNPETMLRPQRLQRLQNHQVERPLQYFRRLCFSHAVLPLHAPKEATISPLQCP